jgi:RNA polymerase sigma factor (sigma-70 family)
MSNQAWKEREPNNEAPATPQPNRSFDEVFSLVYEELRRLASFARRNEVNTTINSTALVHEAWLKLKDSPHLAAKEVSHFKAIAAKAMRQVLVDESRRRAARKRGGSGEAILVALGDCPDEQPVARSVFDGPLSTNAGAPAPNSLETIPSVTQLLELDAMLNELSHLNARQAQIVEHRFFGGLTVTETAAELGVSESSVERDWRAAKAWLSIRIRPAKE